MGRFGSLAFLVLRPPFLPWASGSPAARPSTARVLFWWEDSLRKSLALSILPSLLFLERGILTGNWALTLFALLFAPCHITLSARDALAQRKETGL